MRNSSLNLILFISLLVGCAANNKETIKNDYGISNYYIGCIVQTKERSHISVGSLIGLYDWVISINSNNTNIFYLDKFNLIKIISANYTANKQYKLTVSLNKKNIGYKNIILQPTIGRMYFFIINWNDKILLNVFELDKESAKNIIEKYSMNLNPSEVTDLIDKVVINGKKIINEFYITE